MAEMVEDPRTWDEGYQEAVGGLRDKMTGAPSAVMSAPPPQGIDVQSLLQQTFMQMQQQQQQPEEKPIPRWLHLIPGAMRGVAEAKKLKNDDERLKLERQRLQGQQAYQRLQQIDMMQKIQTAQNAKRWGGLWSGLQRHQDVLDEPATAEIEGNILQELAQAGDPKAVETFLESRREARAEKAMNATQPSLDTGGFTPPDATPAPAVLPAGPSGGMSGVSPAAAPVSAPRTAQRPEAGLYARMIRAEGLRQGLTPEQADMAVAVATQESSLDPQAVGDGGQAIGLFQLHPGAAADVGLQPFERRDAVKNIQGGVGYFKLKLAQAGGNMDKALQLYNGGGDPNYVANVRRHLPASPGMSGMVAGPGAPAPTPAQPQSAVLSVQQRMARDQLALTGHRQRYAQIQAMMTRLGQYGNTKFAKDRLAVLKDQREEEQQQIKRLEDRLTPDTSEASGGMPKYYQTPESIVAGHAQKRQQDLTDYEKKQRLAAEIEPAGAKEVRDLQRQKLQNDIDKEKREQGGPLLGEHRIKTELAILGDVRQEPVHKQFMEVRNGFQNLQAGKDLDNAQGDLAIINGYAKILDPGSTVREGEFNTVAGSQGFFERMGIKFETFMHGDRLAPEARARFLTAGERMAEKKATAASKDLRSKYEPITKRAGLNFDELIPLDMGFGAQPAAPAVDTSTKPIEQLDEAELVKEIERLKKAGGK